MVRRSLAKHSRSAFSLIELVAVVAIVGILIAIAASAVVQSRETARRMHCQNNCRQIALAAIQFAEAKGEFPNSFFSELPEGQAYEHDHGTFPTLLPFLDQGNLAQDFEFGRRQFSADNISHLQRMPHFLKCPSVGIVAQLHDLAPWFGSSLVVDESSAEVGAYVFCAGVNPRPDNAPSKTIGIAGISIPNVVAAKRYIDVKDGFSYTLCGWETANDRIFAAPGMNFDFDTNIQSNFKIWFTDTDLLETKNRPTGKAWYYAWAGLGAGTLSVYGRTSRSIPWESEQDGQVINFSNVGREPFSHHPGGANFFRLDGSVHFVNQSVAKNVMLSLATIQGGERNSGEVTQ